MESKLAEVMNIMQFFPIKYSLLGHNEVIHASQKLQLHQIWKHIEENHNSSRFPPKFISGRIHTAVMNLVKFWTVLTTDHIRDNSF